MDEQRALTPRATSSNLVWRTGSHPKQEQHSAIGTFHTTQVTPGYISTTHTQPKHRPSQQEKLTVNTLNNTQTTQLLGDPNAHHALRHQWSALLNSERKHTLTSTHHLIYLALTGKDWRKAFTPVTNTRKLLNGGYNNWGLHDALHALKFAPPSDLIAPFDGLLTYEVLPPLRALLPTFNHTIDLTADRFRDNNWPFDAYNATAISGIFAPITQAQEPTNA